MAIVGYGVVSTSTLVERGVTRGTYVVNATATKEVTGLGVGAGTSELATVHSITPNAAGTSYTVVYTTRGVNNPAIVDTVPIVTWAVEASI